MGKFFKIEVLAANEGDCLWIEYGDQENPHKILIDGGTSSTYDEALRQKLVKLDKDQRNFELLVITHVDDDHIAGILKLLEDDQIDASFDEVWFNAYRHLPVEKLGPPQGELLTRLLLRKKKKMEEKNQFFKWNECFGGKAVSVGDQGFLDVQSLKGGMKIRLVSPNDKTLEDLEPVWVEKCKAAKIIPLKEGEEPPIPEQLEDDEDEALGGSLDIEALAATSLEKRLDKAEANGSSIAFIMEFMEKRVFLTGDAYSSILLEGIEKILPRNEDRLKVDAFKMPHHGSKANITKKLLDKIDCNRFIFSTNGNRFRHPNREAVARVIKHRSSRDKPRELIFNYKTNFNEIWEDKKLMKKYHYLVSFPKEIMGQTILFEE